jgi:hypothetical protein
MAQMGAIYCDILSFANTKQEPEIQNIVSSLIALRNKLKKSATLNTNVIYEVRYHVVDSIQYFEVPFALVFIARSLASRTVSKNC